MNELRVLLVAVALLTAACGTATISGLPVKSVSNSENVRIDGGANAGTDVAAGATDSELNRVNPTVRKGAAAPVQQSRQPASNGIQPLPSGHDRCSDGVGANAAVGSSAGTVGKSPPQPECPVE